MCVQGSEIILTKVLLKREALFLFIFHTEQKGQTEDQTCVCSLSHSNQVILHFSKSQLYYLSTWNTTSVVVKIKYYSNFFSKYLYLVV